MIMNEIIHFVSNSKLLFLRDMNFQSNICLIYILVWQIPFFNDLSIQSSALLNGLLIRFPVPGVTA